MRRPYVHLAFAFIVIGTGAYYQLQLSACLMAVYLMFLILLQFEKKTILLCGLASLLFMGYVAFEKKELESLNTGEEQNKTHIFEGVILAESLLSNTAYGVAGNFVVENPLNDSNGSNQTKKLRKITLRLKLPYKNPEKFQALLKSGQGVRMTGRLNPIQLTGNVGDFNYRYYLWGKGYDAEFVPSVVEPLPSCDRPLEKLRMAIGSAWLKRIYEHTALRQGPLAVGILLGEDGFLNPEIQEAYKLTGTTHILTVSGVHFGILMLWVHKLLSLKEMSYNTRKIIAVFLMTGFLWIIGFDTAAMRAYWMVLMLSAMMRLYAQPDPLTALSLTALLMLLFRPSQLLSVSFQMSMAAMFGLMVIYPMFKCALKQRVTYNKWLQKYFVEPLLASISVNCVMMPFLMHYFNAWAWSSLLYNIPVAWISAVVIPLLALLGPLTFLEPLSVAIGLATGGLLHAMTAVVATAETFGILPIIIGSLKPWQLFSIAFVFLLILFEKQNKWAHQMKRFHRVAIVFLVSSSLIIAYWSPTNGYHEAVFMDVGQGDGAYLKLSNGTTLLMDSGKKKTVGDGSSVLLKSGVTHIDYWIISHFHDDHMGSYEALMKQHAIGKIEVYDKGTAQETPLYKTFVKTAGLYKILLETKAADDTGPLKNVKYLWPPKNYASKDLNDESLVAQVSMDAVNFLFTGDMTSQVECDIMKKVAEGPLVLKIPHHGSKYSSSEAVYNEALLVSAVCSVGRNTYGHPNDAVMTKYISKTPYVFRTDQSGSVSYLVKGNRLYYKTYY